MPDTEFPEDIDARITALIESLYKRYYKEMVMYAYSIVHDREIAESIVLDCLRKIWTATPKKKLEFLAMQPDKMKAYFQVMVRNACIDWLNQPGRRRMVFDTDEVETKLGNLSDDERNRLDISEDVIEHFHKKFAALSEDDKKVCVNRFLFEREVKEIAERMGLSINQTEFRLKKLRNWFKTIKK